MKRKKKKLSELKAWQAIKQELSEYIDCGTEISLGLCGMIEDLEMEEAISSRMADRMNLALSKAIPRRRGPRYDYFLRNGYYWDLEKNGVKARISFCNKQIKRLTP